MLNKVFLMGRLTRDPELRTSQSGIPVTSFGIAVDRRFAKQGEEKQTDFFNVVCFRQQAEFVKKYFVKGQLVCIVGSVQTRTVDGNDGRKTTYTDIVADEVHFTGDKRENSGQQSGAAYRPSPDDYLPPAYSSQPSSSAPPAADDGFMTVEDDQLPF
jgi:single-strand DNA-binding protein